MKQLDLTKPVQQRDGTPVEIITASANYVINGIANPVIGIAKKDGNEQLRSWQADGQYLLKDLHVFDLINVPVKQRVTGWLNVYSGFAAVHFSRQEADKIGSTQRIACIPIDIEYTEGDGLDGAQ